MKMQGALHLLMIPLNQCTPHRPIIKKYIDKNAKRLYGDHSSVTAEPAFVKRYMETLANRDFCKKKLDIRFDTHCIKAGVQLCYNFTYKVMIEVNQFVGNTEKAHPPRFSAGGEQLEEKMKKKGEIVYLPYGYSIPGEY